MKDRDETKDKAKDEEARIEDSGETSDEDKVEASEDERTLDDDSELEDDEEAEDDEENLEGEAEKVIAPRLRIRASMKPSFLWIANEGYLAIGVVSALALVSYLIFGCGYFVTFFLFLLGFVLWFFRDPERGIPLGSELITSPADGKIIKVEKVREEVFLKSEALKISVFMNVFDMHVNRAPADLTVLQTKYFPGKFINASFDKASEDNERHAFLMKSKEGSEFVLVQIAGLIARRIVTYVQKDAELLKGERFGMIKFGSRVDIYLPVDVEPLVSIGDRVFAGSSVLAKW